MLEFLNKNLFGPALPAALIICGLILTFKMRGSLLFHPIGIIKALLSKKASSEKGERSAFAAATLALAGTLGVGNITGVAVAITAGGPGAIFWMWLSAIAAMPIKYAEIALSVYYKNSGLPGAASYIADGFRGKFRKFSKLLAKLFLLLCVVSSFSLGNIVQVSAAADAAEYVFSLPPAITGIAFAFVTFAVIRFGGDRGADTFAMAVIPALSAIYTLISIAIIVSNVGNLPGIFHDIISDALSLPSVVGGASGYAVLRFLQKPAVRFGTARGIISNEAGCGTSPFAHQGRFESPAKEGLWGLYEVFADTILLCTLTALVILAAPIAPDLDGTALVIHAYTAGLGSLGSIGGGFIALSVVIYAAASVVCWSRYGIDGIGGLTKSKLAPKVYLIAYCGISVYGAIAADKTVWELADAAISAMTILNTLCVVRLFSAKDADSSLFPKF